MIWIAKLILHCVVLATFLPKSDLDYRPIIPLQITHQITKVLISDKNDSSAVVNETKIIEPKIIGQQEYYDSEDKNRKVGKSKPTTADGYVKEAAALMAAGQTEAALKAFKDALKIKPNDYKIRIEMGDLLKSLSRSGEAEKSYLKAIKTKPDYGTAWFKLGALYYAEGKMQLAVDNLTKAVNLDSTLLDALLILGQILKSANHLGDAITCFQQALKLSPNHSVAQFHLAWIYMDQGRLDLALKTLQQSSKDIQQQPQYYDVYSNLCTAFHVKGQSQVATNCFMNIVDQNPNHAVSLGNLGILKQMNELYEEASTFFKRALQVSPDLVDSNYNLAICYQQLRKFHDALRYYQETIRLSPSYPYAENIGELVVDMGDKFLIMKDHNSAVKCYSFAIEISPTVTMTHYKLGVALQRGYNIKEAIQSFQNVLNRDPNFEDAYYKMEHCLNIICDWTNYDARIEKLAKVVNQDLTDHQRGKKIPALFSLGYPLSHEQRTRIAMSYANGTLEKIDALKSKRNYKHPTKLTRAGRLRIGFVSSDFGHHPVGHLIQSLPGVFDRKRYEIFCYSLSPDDNSIFRAKIVRESEHFVDLSKVENDGDAADLINADGIHVLINMNGYTTGSRDAIFAFRPAPIQAMWLGYPATSGAPFMDYIIADPISAPLELASQFTEKVAHMPNSYFLGSHQTMFAHLKNKVILTTESMPLDEVRDNAALINCDCDLSPLFDKMKIVKDSYTIARLPTMNTLETMVRLGQFKTRFNGIEVRNGAFFHSLEKGILPEAEAPKDFVITTRQQYGLPDNAIVYCNFQQLYKINPTILKVWVNILIRVPKSVLWLPKYPPGAVNNIVAYAESLGLEKGRIIFCNPTQSKEEYARRMQLADVALDSNLFNGHTTGLDILWAGTPMISIPGETFVSRVGASQLTAIGCPELIASNLKDYENIAVKLGTNREYLKKIRAKVWIGRTESTLFNIRAYAKDMGHLFLRMWKTHESGENPHHITLND